PRETIAAEDLKESLGMPPCHIGVGLAFLRPVAEMAPAVDDLLGRTPADAELKPAAGDEIRRSRGFGHVQRILVTHVDDGRADLDRLRARADSRQERKWRSQLPREMVDAEIGAVSAEFLGGNGEVDGLKQRIGGGPRSGMRGRRPVPEREEANL